ncbi:MAG: HAMP domain-containing sensor histidine kinase, partial [Coriobacteriia bacterium]|nr:HAMP domain-containing sensor histidine kinase [Coriobacteriia bacterium]
MPVGQARTFSVDALAEFGDGNGSPGEGGADPGVAFLASAVGVESAKSGPVTVVVVASLDSVRQLVDLLVPRLAFGLPLILLIVGLTVWAITAWALRPVDAIRSEAEAISASSLERRVPEPATSDEIGRLAETMNRMLDRLEPAALMQRRFVSDASHELKSPVAAIRTMLDVARREHPSDMDGFLDDLSAEDLRLEHLVNDLLVLARFDERSAVVRAVDVDFDDVVLAEMASLARTSAIFVDVSALHPVRLKAVPGSLESLVRNLLENAAHHASSSVHVELEIAHQRALFIHGTRQDQIERPALTLLADGSEPQDHRQERTYHRKVVDEVLGDRDGIERWHRGNMRGYRTGTRRFHVLSARDA